MSWFEALAILVAGVGAGTINTIVGSGTLITFPTLLFFGYPPLAANISNNVGLVAGGATGSWAYRHEMRGGIYGDKPYANYGYWTRPGMTIDEAVAAMPPMPPRPH